MFDGWLKESLWRAAWATAVPTQGCPEQRGHRENHTAVPCVLGPSTYNRARGFVGLPSGLLG